MSIIEFHGGNKFFGDFQVLEDIDFTLDLPGVRFDRVERVT